MNMHAFYRQLSGTPSEDHLRRLAGLTRLSRARVLKATSEISWYIWDAPGA